MKRRRHDRHSAVREGCRRRCRDGRAASDRSRAGRWRPAAVAVVLVGLLFPFAVAADETPESEPQIDDGGGRFVVSEARTPRSAPAAIADRPAETSSLAPSGIQAPGLPNEPPRKAAAALPGNEIEGLTREDVIPATGPEYPLDLSTALQLAESQNPTIALGRQAIREALALQLGARALLLPSLNAGSNYHLHQGTLQTSGGTINSLDEQSIYFGGGARALAAETVGIPAVHLFAHLGDAYYAPLAAAQVVGSRSADARGIENAVLLDVGARYLDLMQAEADLTAIRRSEDNLQQVVKATAAFARTGQGRIGDFHRARTDALLLHAREERAQEAVVVASADLARTLHLDPSLRLKTPGGDIEVVQLVDPSYGVEQLVQMAQTARPEAAARGADIAAAEYRLKQEYARPFLPLVSVGFSAGEFGGGSDQVGSLAQRLAGRTDFDAYAVWTLQNLGFGNAAVQKERRAERDEAIARRGLVFNRIAREVADAYAVVQARRQALQFAHHRLATAMQGAAEEIARTRGGEGLPLEAINSVDLLTAARSEVIAALVGYDRAQLELFVAVGQTPSAALPEPGKPR